MYYKPQYKVLQAHQRGAKMEKKSMYVVLLVRTRGYSRFLYLTFFWLFCQNLSTQNNLHLLCHHHHQHYRFVLDWRLWTPGHRVAWGLVGPKPNRHGWFTDTYQVRIATLPTDAPSYGRGSARRQQTTWIRLQDPGGRRQADEIRSDLP